MSEHKTFYITTPIYYPSDKLHIGHSYTTVACDALARFKRMQGYDVMFLTGTDEHGQKIQDKAADAGVTPKEYVDKIVATVKDLWKLLDVSYDRFIRTTDDYHMESCQKIFTKLYEQGDIYKGEYIGNYCKPCESFCRQSAGGAQVPRLRPRSVRRTRGSLLLQDQQVCRPPAEALRGEPPVHPA